MRFDTNYILVDVDVQIYFFLARLLEFKNKAIIIIDVCCVPYNKISNRNVIFHAYFVGINLHMSSI